MKATTALTTVIEIRNKEGKKIGEKEVATYPGLLARAHDEGLRRITTRLLQTPTKDNGETAIVAATVVTQKGRFTGIGDANPGNVGRHIAAHTIRMAETRAKARALRDAVNIGLVSLEELADLHEEEVTAVEPAAGTLLPPRSAPAAPARSEEPRRASEAQRRLIFRLATERGVKVEEIATWIEQRFELPSAKAMTTSEASRVIEELKATNGHAEVGHA